MSSHFGDPVNFSTPNRPTFRDPTTRPAVLLSKDLLATYRHINEVYYKKKKSVDYEVKGYETFAERYDVVKPIGKGSFGQVVQAFDKQDNEHVAIKIIKNKTPFYNQALIEIKILEHLNAKDPESNFNGVRMKNHFMYENHLCIVFELLSYNLYDLVKSTHFHGIAIQFVRKFAFQLLNSLWFLARPDVDIIHCDLKPENILLKEPKRSAIKVIDFGSSCHSNGRMYKYIQSRFYRSPEVLLELEYGHPIDMWSLGCILVEIHIGEPLFPGANEVEQMIQICSLLGLPPVSMLEESRTSKKFFEKVKDEFGNLTWKYKFQEPEKKDLGKILAIKSGRPNTMEMLKFKDLIERMLTFDPKQRISPVHALQHSFFVQTAEESTTTSAQSSPVAPREHQNQQYYNMQQMMAQEMLLKEAAQRALKGMEGGKASEDRRRPNSRASAPSTIRQRVESPRKDMNTQTNAGIEPMQM